MRGEAIARSQAEQAKADKILALLDNNPRAVMRALVVLYQRQTSDEQATGTATYLNGRGFNGLDANFGSDLARQVLAGRNLSDRQLHYARKIVRKYVGQLLEAAEEKAARNAA